ncbi:DNA polymerase III PolC-type-like [Clytia hemisphaerica]|uniref:DNA polymerase III PolC-type-like n=1 Tax=Clytia hemisphaerica TaxID=252671 RepID=UPI0034D5FC29
MADEYAADSAQISIEEKVEDNDNVNSNTQIADKESSDNVQASVITGKEDEDSVGDLPYIVFDTETTGLDSNKDRIVQLSMTKVFSTERKEQLDIFINPELDREYQLQSKAYEIHNLHPDFLAKQKLFHEHAEEILKFFKGAKLVFGHNVRFDWKFLVAAFTRLGNNEDEGKPWIDLLKEIDFKLLDTLKMSRAAYPKPELLRHRLKDVAEHLNINTKGLHNSMVDVEVTNKILINLMEKLSINFDDLSTDTKYFIPM